MQHHSRLPSPAHPQGGPRVGGLHKKKFGQAGFPLKLVLILEVFIRRFCEEDVEEVIPVSLPKLYDRGASNVGCTELTVILDGITCSTF